MADVHREITDDLARWIAEQPVFFVASAPSGDGGHVNVSPKGLDSFRILGPRHVAYLDYTGSGAETIAHVRQNGRITVMFCAFSGRPRILRLYGRGTAHLLDTDGYRALAPRFDVGPGSRAVIEIEVDRVWTSCGYGVPLMDLAGPRPDMVEWAEKKGEDGLVRYRASKNSTSIDGLPAFGS